MAWRLSMKMHSVGVMAVAVMMWGCQATRVEETEWDRALRVYARANGVEVGAGKVEEGKLGGGMVEKGGREADLAIAELKKQMAGKERGHAAVREALLKLIETGRRQEESAAVNIANVKTPGYRPVDVDR